MHGLANNPHCVLPDFSCTDWCTDRGGWQWISADAAGCATGQSIC